MNFNSKGQDKSICFSSPFSILPDINTHWENIKKWQHWGMIDRQHRSSNGSRMCTFLQHRKRRWSNMLPETRQQWKLLKIYEEARHCRFWPSNTKWQNNKERIWKGGNFLILCKAPVPVALILTCSYRSYHLVLNLLLKWSEKHTSEQAIQYQREPPA